MSELRIVYAPRADATPEAETSTLITVYRFVIDRANRNAADGACHTGDDAERDLSDSASIRSTA